MKCDWRSWVVELSNDNSAVKGMGSLVPVLYMAALSCFSHPFDNGQPSLLGLGWAELGQAAPLSLSLDLRQYRTHQ
jgi:hypothetical protein